MTYQLYGFYFVPFLCYILHTVDGDASIGKFISVLEDFRFFFLRLVMTVAIELERV
jgi:hypothetical protein